MYAGALHKTPSGMRFQKNCSFCCPSYFTPFYQLRQQVMESIGTGTGNKRQDLFCAIGT